MTESDAYQYEGLQVVAPNQPGLETDGRGLEHSKVSHGKAEWASTDQQVADETQTKSSRQSKTFCGLRRSTVLLAILVVLLVAAIAGIAGGLATRKSTTTSAAPGSAQSSSTSSTSPSASQIQPSPSTTSPVSSATASASPYACTNNGTTYMTSDNSLFVVYCNTNFLVGTNYNTSAAVLTVLNLNSFGACLEACSISNSLGVSYSVAGNCQSATWFASGNALDQCYLKNATSNTDGSNGVYQPNDPGSQSGSLVA